MNNHGQTDGHLIGYKARFESGKLHGDTKSHCFKLMTKKVNDVLNESIVYVRCIHYQQLYYHRC